MIKLATETGSCSVCGKTLLYTDRPDAVRPTRCWDHGSGMLFRDANADCGREAHGDTAALARDADRNLREANDIAARVRQERDQLRTNIGASAVPARKAGGARPIRPGETRRR